MSRLKTTFRLSEPRVDPRGSRSLPREKTRGARPTPPGACAGRVGCDAVRRERMA